MLMPIKHLVLMDMSIYQISDENESKNLKSF